MNQARYLEEFRKAIELMFETTKKKNNDYSGEWSADAFKNFRAAEQLWVCSTEQGIVVRMLDKMVRVANLLKQKNFVEWEGIADSLLDLANYSVIMYIYLKEQSAVKESLDKSRTYSGGLIAQWNAPVGQPVHNLAVEDSFKSLYNFEDAEDWDDDEDDD